MADLRVDASALGDISARLHSVETALSLAIDDEPTPFERALIEGMRGAY